MLRLATLAFALLVSTAAFADTTTGNIQVTIGNPQPAETKIFLNAAPDTNAATGQVGSQMGDPGTPTVNFLSDNPNTDFANGFSTIAPHNPAGLINSLTFSVPTGWFFTDLEFSTLKGNSVNFTAMDGNTVIGTYSNDNVGAGLTAWLTESINAAVMTALVIASTDGFTQLKEFEISGLQQFVATPVPNAALLFGTGLMLTGFLARRRRKV